MIICRKVYYVISVYSSVSSRILRFDQVDNLLELKNSLEHRECLKNSLEHRECLKIHLNIENA